MGMGFVYKHNQDQKACNKLSCSKLLYFYLTKHSYLTEIVFYTSNKSLKI